MVTFCLFSKNVFLFQLVCSNGEIIAIQTSSIYTSHHCKETAILQLLMIPFRV